MYSSQKLMDSQQEDRYIDFESGFKGADEGGFQRQKNL